MIDHEKCGTESRLSIKNAVNGVCHPGIWVQEKHRNKWEKVSQHYLHAACCSEEGEPALVESTLLSNGCMSTTKEDMDE